MKKTIKRLCALAAAACLAAAFCLPAFAQDAPPAVSCGAYVVMDADTGQILIEQNPDQRMYGLHHQNHDAGADGPKDGRQLG